MRHAKKTNGTERRRHPRFPVGLSMDIRSRGHSVERCRGSIRDLSVGGMAFKSNAVLEEGASLYLKINIPLEIRGEVRHMRGGPADATRRYGVRFHRIGFSSSDRAKPENFIAAKFQK